MIQSQNVTQLKNEFQTLVFATSNEQYPKAKYLELMKRLIDELNSQGQVSGLEYLIGNLNAVNNITTKALFDEDGTETLAALAIGTKLSTELQGVEYQYKLVAGTDPSAHPFVIRPDDAKIGIDDVQWELQGNNMRIRTVLTPAMFADIHQNPIILAEPMPKKYCLDRVLLSMDFEKNAYKGEAGKKLYISDEVNPLFSANIDPLLFGGDACSEMDKQEKRIVNGALRFYSDASMSNTDGDSNIIVDMFVTLI